MQNWLSIQLTISWRRKPTAREREAMPYTSHAEETPPCAPAQFIQSTCLHPDN